MTRQKRWRSRNKAYISEYNKRYRRRNIRRLRKLRRIKYQENRAENLRKAKIYRRKRDKNKVREYVSKYRKCHRLEINRRMRNWKRRNPDKRRKYGELTARWKREHPDRLRDCSLYSRFGITLQQFKDILKSQDNRCWICETRLVVRNTKNPKDTKRSAHADHDHRTGNFRGILCMNCNNGLGCFRDDIDSLQGAISYLRR